MAGISGERNRKFCDRLQFVAEVRADKNRFASVSLQHRAFWPGCAYVIE